MNKNSPLSKAISKRESTSKTIFDKKILDTEKYIE